ncbi:hypothetical protein V6N13_022968 [Hibiscus sabdariffa]
MGDHNGQNPADGTVRDYLVEDLDGLNPAVTILEFEAEHFELKHVMFNMLNTLGQFSRSPAENARQEDDEAMHEAWERYRDLFRRCPMHGLPEWTQVSIFYNSVNTPTRMMLDASANDTLLDKPPREGLKILEKLAQIDYQHPTTHRGTMMQGTAQLDSSDTILAQIFGLTNMVKNLQKHTAIHEVKVLE